MIKNKILCPKCNSEYITSKTSHGGPCIYVRLICQSCGFQGGRAQIVDGIDWESKMRSRFKESHRDAVEDFISRI